MDGKNDQSINQEEIYSGFRMDGKNDNQAPQTPNTEVSDLVLLRVVVVITGCVLSM